MIKMDYYQKVKFNAKHSEFPNNSVYKTEIGNLKQVQGTIIQEKVEGIIEAIFDEKSGKIFDPFIVYKDTLNIFDGNHRYIAIMEINDKHYIIPYIEDIRDEEEPEGAEDIEIEQIKADMKELDKLKENLIKDAPVTTETTGYYNPRYSDDIEDERIKGALEDCVAEKIPKLIEDEGLDQEDAVGRAYGMCRDQLGLPPRKD